MKTLDCLVCILAGANLTLGGESTATQPPAPRTAVTPELINQLSEELRTNHPALKLAAARASAARAGAAAVRTWKDPMLMIGGLGADTMMRMDEGDILYGVEQEIPLWGRPRATRHLAEAEVSTREAEGDLRFQTLRRDLAQALFAAALADRVLELGSEDLAWLATLEAATDQRYRVGEATLAQSLRVQNERARRADLLETERQRRDQAIARVNRLLGRDLRTPWPRLELPPPAGPVPYTDRLVAFAEDFEPRLKALRAMTREAEAGVELSRRERHPEVSLGAEARNYSGNGDFRQVMFTLRLSAPWANRGRYRADVARQEANLAAARHEAQDYTQDLREEVFRLTVALDTARRQALLYRDDIIPRSDQALASAHADWLANRGPFWDVLEARRMLIEARLEQARAVAEQYEMLSDLVLCCGLGDLEALEMIGAQALPPSATPPQQDKP